MSPWQGETNTHTEATMCHRTTFEYTIRDHTVTVIAWGEDDSPDCNVDWELHSSVLDDDALYGLLEYDDETVNDLQAAAVRAVDREAGRC